MQNAEYGGSTVNIIARSLILYLTVTIALHDIRFYTLASHHSPQACVTLTLPTGRHEIHMQYDLHLFRNDSLEQSESQLHALLRSFISATITQKFQNPSKQDCLLI